MSHDAHSPSHHPRHGSVSTRERWSDCGWMERGASERDRANTTFHTKKMQCICLRGHQSQAKQSKVAASRILQLDPGSGGSWGGRSGPSGWGRQNHAVDIMLANECPRQSFHARYTLRLPNTSPFRNLHIPRHSSRPAASTYRLGSTQIPHRFPLFSTFSP